MKETVHSKVDSVKRGVVSWEELVFLEQKSDDGKHLCPNLKDKDEHCIFKILSNFKMQLTGGNNKLEEARKNNPRFFMQSWACVFIHML